MPLLYGKPASGFSSDWGEKQSPPLSGPCLPLQSHLFPLSPSLTAAALVSLLLLKCAPDVPSSGLLNRELFPQGVLGLLPPLVVVSAEPSPSPSQ